MKIAPELENHIAGITELIYQIRGQDQISEEDRIVENFLTSYIGNEIIKHVKGKIVQLVPEMVNERSSQPQNG